MGEEETQQEILFMPRGVSIDVARHLPRLTQMDKHKCCVSLINISISRTFSHSMQTILLDSQCS